MTLSELLLIQFSLNKIKEITEPIEKARQIIQREIKLKEMDPRLSKEDEVIICRVPNKDINGNLMDGD